MVDRPGQDLVPDLEAVCLVLEDIFTFIVIVSKNEILFLQIWMVSVLANLKFDGLVTEHSCSVAQISWNWDVNYVIPLECGPIHNFICQHEAIKKNECSFAPKCYRRFSGPLLLLGACFVEIHL